MTPASPVIEGYREIVFAEHQPEYSPLPAIVRHGVVTTRWRLSWRERLAVLFTGHVYLQTLTCGKPLQPLKVLARKPEL